MKLTKLMLSASVAALALVSCNKMDSTPEVAKRLKTVEVSIGNIALTKALAGDKIENGDAVLVKDFQIFLTDASGNSYEAKVADGSAAAQTYWSTVDLAAGAINAAFHYVDPNCTKVVAVANVGKQLTFAEYKSLAALEVGNQQNQKAIALYDEKNLVVANKQHTDSNANGTTYVSDVYKADLVLTPRISRFEVDGFTVKFNAEPKYDEIKITQLAIQNYYPTSSLVTGTESGTLVNHVANLTNQADVYAWLDATPAEVWYRDYFDLTITPAAATKDTPKPLAYHVFSSDATPVMIIKLLADNQPAYLYSKGFYKADGTPVTTFEEGKIYRMSAKGEVANDGSIPIDEDDIDPMDRCLEITVDVVDWAVELVYPEF
jgi:hypothetical protein